MKTKLFIAALTLVGVVGLGSCSDNDDNKVINNENLVKSDEEAYALVNGSFQAFQDLCSVQTVLSDVATEYGSGYFGNEVDNLTKSATLEYDETNDYPVWAWDDYYWAIGTANDAIEKVGPSTDVSATAKTEVLARAKFIRGLAYSKLVVYFGEVPLRLSTTDSTTVRSSIDQVYNQIVSDLTDAETGLPATATTPVTPTKGAADALLSRVYLQWASNPLSQSELAAIASGKTDPTPSYNRSRLESAIEYANKVIESGRYDLKGSFSALFGRANESSAPEHIFTIQHDGDGIDVMGNHQYHCAWTYPFQPDKVSHIHPISLFEDWDDADPRKAFSIITSLTDPQTDSTYSYLPPYTLPVFGKGVDRSYTNSERETIETNDVDRIEIRYAEVLLNKAEALVLLGRANEALPIINQIRERAYGNTSHNLTAVTLADVQAEWLHEFVYEQNHWQNLVRWKTLVSTLQSVRNFKLYDDAYATTGNQVDGGTVTANVARAYNVLHAKYNNADAHLYRFPIPVGLEGEDLGVRPQNPGY